LAFHELPTFNLTIEEEFKLVPPDGVYAVNVMVENESYKGILNIKNNTGNPERKVSDIGIEIHLFDTDKDMCGKTAIVLFAKRIRDEKTFDGLEELKKQILLDKAEVEELIF
jgi:riboflavin kinase/FMN adenylyltransferase